MDSSRIVFLTEHGTQIPRGVRIYTIDETVEKWRMIIVPLVLVEEEAPPLRDLRSILRRGGKNSEPIYVHFIVYESLILRKEIGGRLSAITSPPFSLFMNLLAELPFTTRGRCTRKSDCASSPLRGSSPR